MLDKLKAGARKIRRELKIYQLVLKDPRTPILPKIILALAFGYLLLPFDIIPDFIPVIGYLDDLIIVPVLFLLALKLIPKSIVEDCKAKLRMQSKP